jgi:hypothetical protein
MDDALKKCPFCAELINNDAIKCKHCGEFLNTSVENRMEEVTEGIQRKWNPGVAGLLSFLIPGAGQIYKGNVGAGFGWLIVVIIGYWLFILPGIILHIICIVNAASGDRNK